MKRATSRPCLLFSALAIGLFTVPAWTSQSSAKPDVYNVVYNVSDLPVWRLDDQKTPAFDASVLIEHIKSSLGPDVVAYTGIQPFPSNVSIVISQTRDGHEQVKELLRQLRQPPQ